MYDSHHQVRVPKPIFRWLLLGVILALVAIISYSVGMSQSAGSDVAVIENSSVSEASVEEDSKINSDKEFSASEFVLSSVIPTTWTTTEVQEFGLKFSHPASFGTAELSEPFGKPIRGKSYLAQFSNLKELGNEQDRGYGLFHVGAITSDYEDDGRGSALWEEVSACSPSEVVEPNTCVRLGSGAGLSFSLGQNILPEFEYLPGLDVLSSTMYGAEQYYLGQVVMPSGAQFQTVNFILNGLHPANKELMIDILETVQPL